MGGGNASGKKRGAQSQAGAPSSAHASPGGSADYTVMKSNSKRTSRSSGKSSSSTYASLSSHASASSSSSGVLRRQKSRELWVAKVRQRKQAREAALQKTTSMITGAVAPAPVAPALDENEGGYEGLLGEKSTVPKAAPQASASEMVRLPQEHATGNKGGSVGRSL